MTSSAEKSEFLAQSLSPKRGGSPATLFAYDSGGALRWVKNSPQDISEDTFMSLLEAALVSNVSHRTFQHALARVHQTGEIFYGECTVTLNGDQHRFEVSLIPHINDRVLGVANDLGQRAPNERAVRDLSLELAHRTKNLMAVISSLAVQTARRISSVDDFTKLFVGQIGALSGAHNAIAATGWQGAALRAIVDSEVVAHLPRGEVSINGDIDAVTLSPNAAQNIAMVLHELISHCGDCAVVDLTFKRGENGEMVLSWKGTQSVSPDLVWDELLTKVVPMSLDGEAVIDHDEAFLNYSLTISPKHFMS